jgi:biofilm PGA synthesis lipoprotein PgaB
MLGQIMGLPFLHWNEIEQMHLDGFSFYSHTYYSHDFAADAAGNPVDSLTTPIYLKGQNRMETDAEYQLRVKTDLEKADQLIAEHLGPQIQLFCFPHGRYNQTLLQIANETGIHYFFTGIDGLNTPGTTLVRRISAGTDKVTPMKLLQKLNDETTLLGRMKIMLKNFIVSQRGSE